VAVNDNDTWVMLSTGPDFSAPTRWSGEPCYGNWATLLGDITGDDRADLVAVDVFSIDGGDGDGDGEGGDFGGGGV
jgi:hypothetical protein